MAGKNDICSTQLISGDGTFNVYGLHNFSEKAKLCELKLDYAVVSIIGPQGSGKSTLLNHIFGTKFAEMDAKKGWSQTTRGIWLAKADNSIYPCVLVLDVEGSDGAKHGVRKNEDVAFEKQTALFALAISDVTIVNMSYVNVGREQGGSWPLLSTVFEMPRETLRNQVNQGMQKIYDSIPKPAAHKNTPLSDLFNVQFHTFSSYEDKKDEFKKQVSDFKLQFINSTASGGLAEDKGEKLPAPDQISSSARIWSNIKENKDLHLPSHKIMVAKWRCGEIANEKYEGFASSKEWRHIKEALKEDLESGSISDFGKNLSSLLDTYLSEYDTKTCYFDKNEQSLARQNLQEKLLQLRQPTYQSVLKHLQVEALNGFKDSLSGVRNDSEEQIDRDCNCRRDDFLSDFGKQCRNATIEQENWQFSNVLDELRSDMDKKIGAHQKQAAIERAVKKCATVVLKKAARVAGFVASMAGVPLINDI